LNQLSDRAAKNLYTAIKKREKKEGRKWQDVMMDFVFGVLDHSGNRVPMEMSARERIAALRLIADITMIKQSEQNVTVTKSEGPTIYLPKLRKPGELVAIEGGKENSATGT
jgi:hypothetical protein